MGVAPAPEDLPLPKFLERVAATGAPQTSQQSGLLGVGPPVVPAQAQPEMVVPRNYNTNGSELPAALNAVGLAAAGW